MTLSSAQAADEQVIYGIKPDGDLLYYKYLGMSDGSFSWGKTNSKIGNGRNFRQIFSGGDGVIFAITEAGDLLYYKYLGMSDGSFSWGKTNVKIGAAEIGSGLAITHHDFTKCQGRVIGTTQCWNARLDPRCLPHAPTQNENLQAAIT